MTNEEIKQAVEEYFKEMLGNNNEFLDNVTGTWPFDAEDWFKAKFNITDWNAEETHWFIKFANDRFAELYKEKYGERDAKLELEQILFEVRVLNEKFREISSKLKKFPTFNNAISNHFGNLTNYLELLVDVENDKIESLNKKEL